jgi:hypothetical protein
LNPGRARTLTALAVRRSDLPTGAGRCLADAFPLVDRDIGVSPYRAVVLLTRRFVRALCVRAAVPWPGEDHVSGKRLRYAARLIFHYGCPTRDRPFASLKLIIQFAGLAGPSSTSAMSSSPSKPKLRDVLPDIFAP